MPVEGEAGNGCVIAGGYRLPPLMFTESEIAALVAGARLIRFRGGAEMAAGAENALRKISAVQSAAPAMAPELAPPARLDRAGGAGKGAAGDRLCRREGAGTVRILRPLWPHFRGKVRRLVAWGELRGDFRVFRPGRIGTLASAGPFREGMGKTLAEFVLMGKHLRG